MVQSVNEAMRKCLLDEGGKGWGELLLDMAMGYRMSSRKPIGHSPYFFMFGRNHIFESRSQHLEEELDPAAAPTQLQVYLDRRSQAFREVMPNGIA